MAMAVKTLEDLLRFPAPHIHDRIYNALDVAAKRRCLAVSKTLRNFVLERGEQWESEERKHNWFAVENPTCVLEVPEKELRKKKCVAVITGDSASNDIFILLDEEILCYKDFAFAGILPLPSPSSDVDLLWANGQSLFLLWHEHSALNRLNKTCAQYLHCFCTKTLTEQRKDEIIFQEDPIPMKQGELNADRKPLAPISLIRHHQDPVLAIKGLQKTLSSHITKGQGVLIDTNEEFILVAQHMDKDSGNGRNDVLLELRTAQDVEEIFWSKVVPSVKGSYIVQVRLSAATRLS